MAGTTAEIIRDFVKDVEKDAPAYSSTPSGSNNATVTLCESSTCCFISETNGDNGCSMSSVDALASTGAGSGSEDAGSVLIFPGGDTSCIFSESTDFAFQVWPGSRDKLMIYFQGGGACFNEITTTVLDGVCTTDANPIGQSGLFNRTNELNTFAEYTIVHILYCSGDTHAGNVTRSYEDASGVPITQGGALNVEVN